MPHQLIRETTSELQKTLSCKQLQKMISKRTYKKAGLSEERYWEQFSRCQSQIQVNKLKTTQAPKFQFEAST